ncbi:PREDICTED: uncharacterized protein LOC109353553 isoform X2 [Lupinus angustifolius]|uniref:uncharacterized protein LOC109353553 isoform X2 n=1 Tax=Lupinus angustifolius TaxID=3871 RepID=UPI00092E2DA4|nr:PREDICTED: uncharacterized protein LOC109353553 isoform X2 [Lupinus angustifolius]
MQILDVTNKSVPQNYSLKVSDMVRVPKEENWHPSKNTDSKECEEVFSMSSSTRNSNSLQSSSNAITKRLGASKNPAILPETTRNCSTQCQPVQHLITNESMNLWQKSPNHIDMPWPFISVLDDGMHHMESGGYSNIVGHPEGTPHVIESLKKSRPSSFLSQEYCVNIKKNRCEVAYEKAIMELQLSELSKISICDLSEASVFSPIDYGKQFEGGKQATSVNMKKNPSSFDFQIQQDLELNSFSSSFDGKSYSSSELCLPDEDSLITFDDPFLMAGLAVVDNSMSSPERNPIEPYVFSPSSPRDMIEKLVESILNDESSPPTEAHLFFPSEDEKHLQGVMQATSISMKKNPPNPGFQIQQDLELNSFNSSLDAKSNSIPELCLPDEDSLITFDEPLLMADVENSDVVSNSMISTESNPVEPDEFSPSSLCDIIEKLMESILCDVNCPPPPHVGDPKVHHGAGLEGFYHSLYARQSHAHFGSNQFNPGEDQQAHLSFQRNNIGSAIHSFFTYHPLPLNTMSQPFLVSQDKRRFGYGFGKSMFHQMMNPGKLHVCSLCRVTPHPCMLQLASCSQKLNTMLWVDTKLRARNWHPYVGGKFPAVD